MKHKLYSYLIIILVSMLSLPASSYAQRELSSTQEELESTMYSVIGGFYSLDHIGPDKFEQLNSVVIANSKELNQLIETEFLDGAFDATAISNLHIPTLLRLTSENDLPEARIIAQILLTRIIKAIEPYSQSKDPNQYLAEIEEPESRMIIRLDQQKRELELLLDELKD